MSRSWPKFGDNPDKYRNLKNSDEDCAAEIEESAQHIPQHGQHKICQRCGGGVRYNEKIDMYECIWDRRCGWVGKLRA